MKEGDDLVKLFDELLDMDEKFDGAIEAIEKLFEYKHRSIRLSVTFDED